MKRTLQFNLLIIFVISLSACSEKTKEGDWDDCIKLSAKTFELSALSDSVKVIAQGSSWWITDVSVNGVYFYEFDGVDQETDSYQIKKNCFTVERRDKNTLVIKLEENLLTVNRVVTVGLEAGDYFDRVTITQKSK